MHVQTSLKTTQEVFYFYFIYVLMDFFYIITMINYCSTYMRTRAQRRNKAESVNILVNTDAQNSSSEQGTAEDSRWKCNLE